MTAERCARCDKNSYNDTQIYRAAINTSRTLGCPVKFFKCPYYVGVFHIRKTGRVRQT